MVVQNSIDVAARVVLIASILASGAASTASQRWECALMRRARRNGVKSSVKDRRYDSVNSDER